MEIFISYVWIEYSSTNALEAKQTVEWTLDANAATEENHVQGMISVLHEAATLACRKRFPGQTPLQ